MIIEEHPLQPFLPANARVLFLGSFPPPKTRWSMEFFYPNWINDFWRIKGLIHFGDKAHFEVAGEKRFDYDKIVAFCREKGLAFYDTARKVRRLKGNADDNFLEIVEGTDVFALLAQLPECRTIVTTGGKASEELQAYLASRGIKVSIPKVGEMVTLCPATPNTASLNPTTLTQDGNDTSRPAHLCWWRMPSSSRAYPMKLENKAAYYEKCVIFV